MSDFETLESRVTYEGPVFNLRHDRVQYPDGRRAKLDVIVHPGAVAILPFDAEGQVWFIRQYRHATGGQLLELPAGTLEPGEPPADCALRELREEIGMGARTITHLGGFYVAPGYTTEFLHAYLATELYPDPLEADADEFIEVVKLPFAEVERRLAAGEIQDGKSLAMLALVRTFLNA
jgi:ADP-ribose pyrophosphatase